MRKCLRCPAEVSEEGFCLCCSCEDKAWRAHELERRRVEGDQSLTDLVTVIEDSVEETIPDCGIPFTWSPIVKVS